MKMNEAINVFVESWKQKILDNGERLRVFDSFPAFLFNVGRSQSVEENMSRIKYSCNIPRPLLRFVEYGTFQETFFDTPDNLLMKNNLWIKHVNNKAKDKQFFSLKTAIIQPQIIIDSEIKICAQNTEYTSI